MSDAATAVLLMAYGTPETPDDVGPYFTHIRGGRPPSQESIDHLRHRYELVGGRTPLLDITRSVEARLAERLGDAYRVHMGMKHWHPYIADVLPGIAASGVRRLICIALAPHYSRISIGGYEKAVREAAAALGNPFELVFVEQWHLQPEFTAMMADLVRDARSRFAGVASERILTVFSAHSLPERIRTWDDPYEAQLLASSRAVADAVGLTDWRFAWQSAGNTGEPWIGPDICDYLDTLHAEGVTHVLQVPIGFVCDHLEVLYDIDYEASRKAASLGMVLRRTEMPNDRPAFIDTLAGVVRAADLAPAVP